MDELKSELFERRWSPSAGEFVPATNLVDVHMGCLRRKVDASSDPPMISNVRGGGFIHRVAFGSA
jgi:two-component system, OmpR family, response regulator